MPIRPPVARLALLLVLLVLSACSSRVPAPLGAEARGSYRVARVAVVVPDSADIWWGAGERELADAAGMDPDDVEAIADHFRTPEGRAALRRLLAERLAPLIEEGLAEPLAGPRPAQLTVLVTRVYVTSMAQNLFVGGSHRLQAGVRLFDLATGEPLTAPQRMAGRSTGGGGILPGIRLVRALIDAARDDPLDRIGRDLGENTGRWLAADRGVSVPLSESELAVPLPPIPGPEIVPAAGG